MAPTKDSCIDGIDLEERGASTNLVGQAEVAKSQVREDMEELILRSQGTQEEQMSR